MVPAGVTAKVTRGAHTGWMCWWNSDTRDALQTATFRTVDGDHDGEVGVALGGTISSGFCVGTDLETGDIGFGRIGTEAGFGALPEGTVLRDPSGAATNVVVEDDAMLLWVRPGKGAWYTFWRSDVAENASFYKTSVMVPLAGDIEPAPPAFARGDVLVALISRPGHGYGSRVDGDLDRQLPGRISIDTRGLRNDLTEGKDFTARLVRTGGADGTVSVRVAGTGGTALEGRDYEILDPIVTFGPGELTKNFSIRPIDDDVYDATRSLAAQLREPVGATLGSITSKELRIADNDLPPVFSFGAVPATVTETNTPWTLSIPVTLTGKTRLTAAVSYALNTDGHDRVIGRIALPPGGTSTTIDIPIAANDIADNDVSLTIAFRTPENARTDRNVTVTIIDDDLPRVSVDEAAVVEGIGARLPIRSVLIGTMKPGASYSWATVDGTAIAGVDYVAASGPATTFIQITILDDAIDEGPETFYLELRDVTGIAVDATRVKMTILDDEAGLPELVVGSAIVTEGAAGTKTIGKVPLRLTKRSPVPVTTSIQFAASAAIYGNDWEWSPIPSITIPAGAWGTNVEVTILGDNHDEPDEGITVQLGRVTNAIPGLPSSNTLFIRDDDPGSAAYLSVLNAEVVEGTGGTVKARFRIELSAAQTHPVSVRYATSDGMAFPGSDYTTTFGALTLEPGETVHFIDVPVHGDALVEPMEAFYFTIYAPDGATLGRNVAEGIIVDDDNAAAPQLSIGDIRVSEDNATAEFTLTLSHASTQPLRVSVTTVAGSALPERDYQPLSQQVTFAPGEISRVVTVQLLDDRFGEGDETFTLQLSSSDAIELVTDRAVCTIADDEATGRRRSVRH